MKISRTLRYGLTAVIALATVLLPGQPVDAQSGGSGGNPQGVVRSGESAGPGVEWVAPLVAAAERPVAGQYIIVLNDGANPRSVAALAGVNPQHVYTAALNGFSASLNAGQLNALRRNPNVAYVEEDQEVTISETQAGATWGLDRIDQSNLPLGGSYSYTSTGAGVTAYIIDTGIMFSHTEFGGRASLGIDKVGDGQNGNDCNGHGTHVAGTVGGLNYGVAKGVTLVPVRVLNCAGSGTWAGVIAGVGWVTENHVKPAVANMSLGGGASSAVDTAVRNSITAGVSYAVAAGNGNIAGIAQDACKYSPARVTEAMTIGATDSADRKASWSNYGNCVDFFAPGVGITSAWIGTTTSTNTISGTSMATPHTTGVAALYLQGKTGDNARPQAVRNALYGNTTKGVVTSSRTTTNHLLFTNY